MCGGFGFINMFYTDNTTTDGPNCGNTTQDTYYQMWFEDVGHCASLETPGKKLADIILHFVRSDEKKEKFEQLGFSLILSRDVLDSALLLQLHETASLHL